jgi:hypothetical protein
VYFRIRSSIGAPISLAAFCSRLNLTAHPLHDVSLVFTGGFEMLDLLCELFGRIEGFVELGDKRLPGAGYLDARLFGRIDCFTQRSI